MLMKTGLTELCTVYIAHR